MYFRNLYNHIITAPSSMRVCECCSSKLLEVISLYFFNLSLCLSCLIYQLWLLTCSRGRMLLTMSQICCVILSLWVLCVASMCVWEYEFFGFLFAYFFFLHMCDICVTPLPPTHTVASFSSSKLSQNINNVWVLGCFHSSCQGDLLESCSL